MNELLLITKFNGQGNYFKCLSCSCRVYKSDDTYKCKNGHFSSNKSREFRFSIFGISLKSCKFYRKTIFGKSLNHILGSNASQLFRQADEKNIEFMINLISDFLVGQIASIRFQTNVVTVFKLGFGCNLIDFLQNQEIQFKCTSTPPNESLLLSKKELNCLDRQKEPQKSIIHVLEFISWQEWFRDQVDQELEEEFSNPIIDDLVDQISDLFLI